MADDEQPARDRMRLLLQELGDTVEVVGEAVNGKEVIRMARELEPDLLLLDIQMPVLDGFDVAELLGEERPPIIFVTAYDEFAIKAFEVHAVDYLLKPVRKERLQRALQRLGDGSYRARQVDSLRQLLAAHEPVNTQQIRKLPVVHKSEVLLVDLQEIYYVEADGKLTWAHLADRKYRADFSMADLEERLSDAFLRIHRSYMVNLNHIRKLEPWFGGGYRLELDNGTELDVARRRVADLKERLGMR